MTAVMHIGDAIETMNALPEKSVDLILTSPPFLALRSYLPADHESKHLEGGSQSTPGEYLDWLLDVVDACARVLAPHGSLVFELGDTYSGSGGGGGDYLEGGWREGQAQFAGSGASARESNAQHWRQKNAAKGWPSAKSLTLIPESFRWAMVYGRNPFTGRECATWRLRNVIRWVRPNPPVGALGDKFRPATSELMVFCKAKDRFFDLDAVRMEPIKEPTPDEQVRSWQQNSGGHESRPSGGDKRGFHTHSNNPFGAPPLDWWNIPPGGYPGAHYAVWPPELLIKPIKAMCPSRVCRVCGEPSRRITESERIIGGRVAAKDEPLYRPGRASSGGGAYTVITDNTYGTQVTTTGWTDCGHDDWRPGVVLDCFGGSGTTAVVATGHGRDCLLVDLDARNFDLALERVGPLVLSGPYHLADYPIGLPMPGQPADVQSRVDAQSDVPPAI